MMKPEAIPRLRRASVPRQSGGDALVTNFTALFDRSLMQAVNLVVERRILIAAATWRRPWATSWSTLPADTCGNWRYFRAD